jgi:hypothetical protein
MITLTLTEEKAQALIDLLDVAVKSGGLQVARPAVVLTEDIVQAIKASKEAAKSSQAEAEELTA